VATVLCVLAAQRVSLGGGDLSLAAFESYVSKGEIHYFIASGSGQGWRSLR
jgi:hypothetical protein